MGKKHRANRDGLGFDADDDITKPNPRLKAILLEIVSTQIRGNAPPVAKETFERLQSAGYTAVQAKEKIATVLVGDIYTVLSTKSAHDEVEYERRLRALE